MKEILFVARQKLLHTSVVLSLILLCLGTAGSDAPSNDEDSETINTDTALTMELTFSLSDGLPIGYGQNRSS